MVTDYYSRNKGIVTLGILVAFCLCILHIYRKCRRIALLSDLPSNVYGIWLSGKVAAVHDGDGFRFFHVPWFRSSAYKPGDQKLPIRLAGIDAPESARFGHPGQPFASEAKDSLKSLVLGKHVKLKLLGIDRYNRLLATCYTKKLLFCTNINKKMVELGMACVYEGSDAVYDGYKEELVKLESLAKKKRLGMWSQSNYVSPMEYKRMLRNKKK